ncbi:Uncharacterized protein dnm_052090 [Desulfonema magnum]|uniref:Uncharacterized protein n=1 Tax=Desulfonema magnum TaxID=45655 RepID=A0A975GPT7_9BACT|nr:Uncharacterized protein dnm_052090 [Desulfonema magnum]
MNCRSFITFLFSVSDGQKPSADGKSPVEGNRWDSEAGSREPPRPLRGKSVPDFPNFPSAEYCQGIRKKDIVPMTIFICLCTEGKR